jgi:hypothetical protein
MEFVQSHAVFLGAITAIVVVTVWLWRSGYLFKK